ncbi:YncE family protein [Myxosarcina sp. GI1]|uniref:YncE family protein n=1 Tax=Myxosarcina sp. GI1 TaxID=1541065 RepID=UPI000561B3D6|nr:hypothetical protein [Myxosarcina sp. GI1]
MNNRSSDNISKVDLVIVIDTSPSMKDEAQALSQAATTAIDTAKSSCPSNLKVTWLGIEGIWKGTNFDRTVRAYLTEECQVSESSFRSRKRGELKSAGAQEDGARVVEDLTDYFNWREGAAKAIFYLGDEALEGGGAKTERGDIEAANIAIQKAQAEGVTVHTYFGTSKSKHRQGIASEYARLATDTGGQAFTDKDTLQGFSKVLEKVICGSRTKADTAKLQLGTVYVQDCISGKVSNLYTLDLNTGRATVVGNIAKDVCDLAMVGSQLYGLNQQQGSKTTQLVKIDRAIGKTTKVGEIGFNVVGLAYNTQRDTLYASAAKQLIAIDLKTGKGKPAVTVSNNELSCGEVAFDRTGRAYISLIGADKKKLLASCDLDSGKVNIIGDIGFPDLASMEFVNNTLYGVTGNFFNLGKDGRLIRIDTQTGKGTVITKTSPLGRWAGMTVYQPALVTKTAATSNNINQKQITAEENMQLLTIDTKNNCYVIDPNGMNDLQLNVASKYTFEKGNYEVQITSGRYSHTDEGGEPSVLLWIYGVDGSTFVNRSTGYETGATWTTLNGYSDRLQLEVKQEAVLCGLFFDVGNRERSGAIELTINSNRQSFKPQKLTVDSQQNCYVLDEKYLSNLKQWNDNFIELTPGNYRIKIREGNASYWSNEKKFQLEPWALLWLKGGKFVTKLTGTEVEETWCSLNGLKDEFIVEVKTKTTISGFFFDTYKEDNEGQIILAVESVGAEEIAKYRQQITQTVSGVSNQVGTASRGTTSAREAQIGSQSSTRTSRQTTVATAGSSNFSFRFDEAQMEQMWQQMAAKIETSVTVTDEQDEKKEAYYWDNLEKWILKGYQTQAKDLAMQVARVEFMMKSIVQQMEVNFNQNFQAWSGYFDNRLEELIDTRMIDMVSEQVNLKVSDRSTEIKNQVVQQLQSDIDKRVESVVNLKISDRSTEIKNQVVQQLQEDIDRRINNVVNLKVENQSQEINNQVVQQLQEDIDRRINNAVNLKVENQSQEINNQVVQQLQSDIDKRIDSVVNLKVTDQTPNIKNLVIQQLQSDVDKRIDSVVNLKLADRASEITNSVTKQLQTDMDKRIDSAVDLKFEDRSQNIKNSVVQQMQTDLDRRINTVVDSKTDNNVQVVVNNVINNVDDRIDVKLENKILNFRDDVTSIVKNELNQNYTDSIKTTVLSDIKKQQFFLDMQTIKAEVNNFYSRLGQFETQLYLRIEQGDTQLYNWTLEQLTALQGCLSDRQTLSEMFQSFASKLKDELDNAPCVQPSRFTPMSANLQQTQLTSAEPQQLPGSN